MQTLYPPLAPSYPISISVNPTAIPSVGSSSGIVVELPDVICDLDERWGIGLWFPITVELPLPNTFLAVFFFSIRIVIGEMERFKK